MNVRGQNSGKEKKKMRKKNNLSLHIIIIYLIYNYFYCVTVYENGNEERAAKIEVTDSRLETLVWF